MQWLRTCCSLVRPVVQKVFELTWSAVAQKRNMSPDRGHTAIHAD